MDATLLMRPTWPKRTESVADVPLESVINLWFCMSRFAVTLDAENEVNVCDPTCVIVDRSVAVPIINALLKLTVDDIVMEDEMTVGDVKVLGPETVCVAVVLE